MKYYSHQTYKQRLKRIEDSITREERLDAIAMLGKVKTVSWHAANRAADSWEIGKMALWKFQGRINRFGLLIPQEGTSSWTLKMIDRAFSHLHEQELWATGIYLDAVITEDEMDIKETFRDAVEQIVDFRLGVILSQIKLDMRAVAPDTRKVPATRVPKGEIVRAHRTYATKRCSGCGTLGHRSDSKDCPKNQVQEDKAEA